MRRTMFRAWGAWFVLVGLLQVVGNLVGDPPWFEVIFGTVVILAGQLVPMPPKVEARIMGLPLLVRFVVIVVVILLFGLLIIGIVEVSGVEPDIAVPVIFLVPGAALLIGSARSA